MAGEATPPDQAPMMDKVAADWRAWYLGVIEQGEYRDERIEAVLRQMVEEYRASLAPASGKPAGKQPKKKGG
jgi:hypothetical protein